MRWRRTAPLPRSAPAAVLVRRCERVVRCVAHSADSGHRASVSAQPFRQAFRETVRLGGYPDLPVGLARLDEDGRFLVPPRSHSRPIARAWLTSTVRFLMSCSRTRCRAWISCCAGFLTGTNLIEGRLTASQIAAASLASF